MMERDEQLGNEGVNTSIGYDTASTFGTDARD